MEKHLFCECGGIIGSYSGNDYCICERCKKEYPFYKLEYDVIRINNKTGWIFPMLEVSPCCKEDTERRIDMTAKAKAGIILMPELDIDEDFAHKCLVMLELYCNSHNGIVTWHREENGWVSLELTELYEGE